MMGMAPPVANDEYGLLRHLRSSALIYCLIGFGVMGVSLALLLALWFANGYLYWCERRLFLSFLTDSRSRYFIFSIVVGAVISTYGVVHLVRYLTLRKTLREHPPVVPLAVLPTPEIIMAEAAAFELQPRWSHAELLGLQQQQSEAMRQQQMQSPPLSREPAPTAPPADFVQQPPRSSAGGVPKPDVDREVDDFTFDPVEYK
jgi:hypothetical protein